VGGWEGDTSYLFGSLITWGLGVCDARHRNVRAVAGYIATGMENVPIFTKADNAENELERFLAKTC